MNNLHARFDEILSKNKTLKVKQKAKDWKDAIKLGVDLLVQAKMAKPEYADKIIAATQEFGPYYIVADNVAMPHAQTSDANLDNGFSMITLEEPVYFGEAPIRVIICLSSTTPDFHVATALPQIAAIFDDEQAAQKLANAQTEQEIYDFIKTVDFNKYLN